MITLNYLREVKDLIKIDAIARSMGLPTATLRHRIIRGSPEITEQESMAIQSALKQRRLRLVPDASATDGLPDPPNALAKLD